MNIPFPVRALPVFAEKAWFTPPPLSSRRKERWDDAVATWERFEIEVDGLLLEGFETGSGPLVYLVHGWGGRASQMGVIGNSLVLMGFHVVALNAPGHGDGRRSTNVYEMTAALDRLTAEFGEPYAVVAHSLGSMASIRSFNEKMPQNLVLLAPVVDVQVAIDGFAEIARLFPWTVRGLQRRLQRFLGDDWSTFSQPEPETFGHADVLIIHDPADPEAPIGPSVEMAAGRERTSLVEVGGIGHNKILRDDRVIALIGNQLARERAETR